MFSWLHRGILAAARMLGWVPAGTDHGAASPPPALRFDALAAHVDRLRVERGYRVFFSWRADTLIALLASRAAPQTAKLSGQPPAALSACLLDGRLRHLMVRRLRPDGSVCPLVDRSDLLRLAQAAPESFERWADGLVAPEPKYRSQSLAHAYGDYLDALRSDPDLVDFLYHGYVGVHETLAPGVEVPRPPFDQPDVLPPTVPAQARRKSALFLHNSYYHYNHLATGLRRRGWDCMTVSLASPDSPAQQFYHGEDLNLWDDDWVAMRDKTRAFFATVPERFSTLHFYGKGMHSFFYDNCDKPERSTPLPWDFAELRRHRMVIGYMASGSLDGARQSSIKKLSGGLCNHCVWEERPDVCNDTDNALWAKRLEAVCDWIGLENDWATIERTGRQYVRHPVITALDPDLWRPDLEPPDAMRIHRAPGEILVYHAVGNYATRRVGARDLKGTGAVMTAIERLQAEGVPVRLIFATDVPSRIVRYLQVQADIVIDQLNYGRLGANARESLMLGKPLISSLDARQDPSLPRLGYIDEAPVMPATEATIYDALKAVVSRPDRWAEMGAASRAFALKWHSADACAARYEKVVDRVRAGLPAEEPVLAEAEVMSQ